MRMRNLRVGTSLHKGMCVSKLNPQQRETFFMLQISVVTLEGPSKQWELGLKLPIPTLLLAAGNRFLSVLKLDLSTKWGFFFVFQGRKIQVEINFNSTGWNYIEFEIPTSQQLSQLPKVPDHIQEIAPTVQGQESLYLVLESTTFSERPSHFWIKTVQISQMKELVTL